MTDNVWICKHVFEGGPEKVEVMMTEENRVEYAVCFACADRINSGELESDGKLVVGPLSLDEAAQRGIPTTLPGKSGFWSYAPTAMTEKIQ